MGNLQKKDKFTGIIFVLIGAVAFSGKAVLAKLIYKAFPVNVPTLLVMRMLLSLPFFLIIFLNEQRKKTSAVKQTDYFKVAGIGILGYYFSSFFDFWGLKYISAGLERVILFTYPAMVVLLSAWLYKVKVLKHQLGALFLTYTGVGIAYAADIRFGDFAQTSFGVLLILGCAFTYSFYVIWGARVIPRVGSAWFTSFAMICATIVVSLHFLISNKQSFAQVFYFPAKVWWYFIIMAIFSTVIPTLLIASGLKRIGSSNVAIISSTGPLATIFLAWFFLDESFGVLQLIGTGFVIAGVLIVGKKAKQAEKDAIALAEVD